MLRGIFDDDTFIDDFFDLVGDIFEGVNDTKKRVLKKIEKFNDSNDEPKEHEHSHSYRNEKKYVDGELVESDEVEWKDGKKVKDEHYSKCLDGKKDENKCISDGKERTDDDDVEYTIEFDEEENDGKCRCSDSLKKKNETLRACVNQLCDDAEKDHKMIEELKRQNDMLRDELKVNDNKCGQRVADLLATIEDLENKIKEKDKLIDAFQHLTNAVHSYDGSQKLNQ